MVIFTMRDSFNRNVDYMRVSVTDRCNLRCKYCVPKEGVDLLPAEEILSYDEIVDICEEAAQLGISKIRITGGEPLVRENIPVLVERLKSIPKIKEVMLTTNGTLLKDQIDSLVKSGLDSVNISLDAPNRESYKDVTGFDLFTKVLGGIEKACNLGIKTKINSVLIDGEYYKDLIKLSLEYGIDVRFIEVMPIGMAKGMNAIPCDTVLSYIDNEFPGWKWDELVHGNGPAKYLRIPGAKGSIGFISAINNKFCDSCNKIRLTADGRIKPCLCFGKSYDIKSPLRQNDRQGVRNIIIKSITEKPKEHCFDDVDKITEDKKMVSIGG